MNTTKILDSEISALKVSSLPSRPTAPTAFGGKGYTAKEMKEAFDKLPLFIIERFNSLIDDICEGGEGSVADSIKTGINTRHTLSDFFNDIQSGTASFYISLGEENLYDFCDRMERDMELFRKAISEVTGSFIETVKTDSGSITLEHARIYRLGECHSLTVSVPKSIADEYFSELSFDSGDSATEFSSAAMIRFSGDDVADEVFIPKENMHYTIFLWYDGEIQGVVRGIPNA